MTEVTFKNEAFTTTIDAIIEKKLNSKIKKITKIMQKATANTAGIAPMALDELMELITGAYIKKAGELNKRTELFLDFDDFVYSVIQQRYGTKKKIAEKSQEFFVGLEAYSS
jgi:hypothetical protein